MIGRGDRVRLAVVSIFATGDKTMKTDIFVAIKYSHVAIVTFDKQ